MNNYYIKFKKFDYPLSIFNNVFSEWSNPFTIDGKPITDILGCDTSVLSHFYNISRNKMAYNFKDENLVDSKSIIKFINKNLLLEDSEQAMNCIWKLSFANIIEEKKGLSEDFIKILKENRFIEYIHHEHSYCLHTTLNDPDYSEQYAIKKIQCDKAWEITRGNAHLKVAVIDTGVDFNHEDLRENMLPEIGKNFKYDDDYDEPFDEVGHGTHVAGIIGAVSNNKIGIAGIADVNMIPIKAVGSQSDDETLANAIRWAVKKGAKIINNSWGTTDVAKDHYTLGEAIKYAHSKNRICVFSAGNNNINIDNFFPGIFSDNIIIVGATDRDDNILNDSNYGNKVSVFAPGEDITSLALRNGFSKEIKGTSAAAPIVSGAIALLLSKYPNLSLEEIKQKLKTTSDDINRKNKITNTGRINVYNLIS